MSWLYSRALVEEYLAESCLDGAQSALSSETPMPQAFLPSDKMMDFLRPSRFGMTFAHLTESLGAELLTWYLAGFHAKTSAPQEKESELMESAPASGVKWRELSTRYDQDSRSWKTHQCLWVEDLPWSSVILPRWGLMRDGVCWEQTTLGRPTGASASGLWPTPGAAKANTDLTLTCSGDGREKPNKLGWAVAQSIGYKVPDRGTLNPSWVEWLMGWPAGWTDLKPLATDKCRSAPPPLGGV